jgi:hypothetical protein
MIELKMVMKNALLVLRARTPVMSLSRQPDEKRPYPANLCPLSCEVEFAGFAEDFGQAVGEPI